MFSSGCPHLSYHVVVGREFGTPTLWFRCQWCTEEFRFQQPKKHIQLHGDLPLTWRFTLTKPTQF